MSFMQHLCDAFGLLKVCYFLEMYVFQFYVFYYSYAVTYNF